MKINVEKTRGYYAALTENGLCSCAYCRNFRREMTAAYPEVAQYLDSLGVDAAKAFETSPLEPEGGFLTYCVCQYIVFGSCEENFSQEVGGVRISRSRSHPATGIEEAHFVLDCFSIRLPWREDV